MKKMYTPVNPSFTIQKWGVRGYSLHGLRDAHTTTIAEFANTVDPDEMACLIWI